MGAQASKEGLRKNFEGKHYTIVLGKSYSEVTDRMNRLAEIGFVPVGGVFESDLEGAYMITQAAFRQPGVQSRGV